MRVMVVDLGLVDTVEEAGYYAGLIRGFDADFHGNGSMCFLAAFAFLLRLA